MHDMGLRFVEYINDPIWGEIPLTQLELEIINTGCFRRLQHIRQMGFAYLGFPTANHRRYEHCIGAMHVAHLLANILIDSIAESDQKKFEFNASHLQAIRLAALLHDIGHAPYSHAFEEAVKKIPEIITIKSASVFEDSKYASLSSFYNNDKAYSHEFFTKYSIMYDKNISDLIDKWNKRAAGFTPSDVASLSVGESTIEGLKLFNPIISGDFDADRIDYICRDSYYCGLSQAFRIAELRRNLEIVNDEENNKVEIRLKEGAISPVNTLLWYRYRLMQGVHSDEKNRIATQVLIRELAKAFERIDKLKEEDEDFEKNKLDLLIEFHTQMTDEDCNEFLKETTGVGLISDLIEENLPHQVTSISRRALRPEEKLFLHLILQEPRALPILEKRYSDEIKTDTIVDVRLSKSPKFNTLVDHGGETGVRSIFDNFYSPHGIMIDSLNTLSVYLYHDDINEYNERVKKLGPDKIEAPFKYPLPQSRLALYRSLEHVYQNISSDWANKKQLFSLDFLITILGVVEDLVHDKFKFRPWVVGDGRLQLFIKQISSSLEKKKLNIIPEYKWTGDTYSLGVFIDFEILQHHGLVNHIHIPVGGIEDGQNWVGGRIDRKLSTFGKRYYNKHLKNTSYSNLVFNIIEKKLEKCSNEISRFLEIETGLVETKLIGKDRDKMYKDINALRKKIKKAGFVPISRRAG